MLKDKKTILKELIEANKNELTILEIHEKFISQKVILFSPNKAVFELKLGQVQAIIQEKNEWLGWLEQYENDLEKEEKEK